MKYYDSLIGVVAIPMGNNARIKVVGVRESNSYSKDETVIQKICPPDGHVFAPSFFRRYTERRENDFIKFRIIENKTWSKDSGHDETILDPEIAPKPIGYPVIELTEDIVIAGTRTVEHGRLQKHLTVTDRNFYLQYKNKIYGTFKVKKGKVIPSVNKHVRCWSDFSTESLFTFKGKGMLLQEPTGSYIKIDCMDGNQLGEWFKKQLKQLKSPLLNQLDESKGWHKELSYLFEQSKTDALAESRFLRAVEHLSDLQLVKEHITELTDRSHYFQSIYQNRLLEIQEELKEKALEKHYKLIDGLEDECGKAKNELKKLEVQISAKEQDEKIANDKIIELQAQITYLKENKTRLIADFDIYSQLMSASSIPLPTPFEEYSFVVEEISNNGLQNYSSITDFITHFKKKVQQYSLECKRAKDLVDYCTHYKCILLPDIRIGIAFAQSTNNCRFIIQQVEPDWLKFKNCWNNGLAELWKSAHIFPEIIHLLLLEDVNLASPECWARPINDLLNHTRRLIPYDCSTWPSNLRIMATPVKESDEIEVGLPMLKSTFIDWAGVKNECNIVDRINSERVSGSGEYLSVKQFNVGRDYDKDEISNFLESYFDE